MKRLDRLFSLLLAAVLLLTCAPHILLTAQAYTVASGACGANGNNLTWVLDSDDTLTISGTGAMMNYDYGESPWCYYYINKVIIKSGVTTIGDGAFYGQYDL